MTTNPISREQLARTLLDRWVSALGRLLDGQPFNPDQAVIETHLDRILGLWQSQAQAQGGLFRSDPLASAAPPALPGGDTRTRISALENEVHAKEIALEVLHRGRIVQTIDALQLLYEEIERLWTDKIVHEIEASQVDQEVAHHRARANEPIDNDDELRRLRLRCLELAEELYRLKPTSASD